MEKKKNIICITGKDRYKVQSETERFIQAFQTRQDANSIDIYRIEEIRDWRPIMQNIQTIGMFVEKRLFLFTGIIPKKKDKDEEALLDGEEDEKKPFDTERILIEICEYASEDTFIIFSDIRFPTSSPLAKWLDSHADMRKYENIWDTLAWSARFPTLHEEEIELVIGKYRKSLSSLEIKEKDRREAEISSAIGQSFEKLSLIRESRKLTPSDYEESLSIESSGHIFDFTSAIMRSDVARAIDIFHTILEGSSIYAFLPSLIGLLRASVYTKYLKNLGKTPGEVLKILTASPYAIEKAYESRISYQDLSLFYDKILSLNTAYRSGKGRKDPELGRIFDIELAIMGLKK